jgi:plasmid maintenance system antidote protein VapI
MRIKYSDCNIISIRFEQEQVITINELALSLGLPRNTVIRRLFGMVLTDVKDGRRIFQ